MGCFICHEVPALRFSTLGRLQWSCDLLQSQYLSLEVTRHATSCCMNFQHIQYPWYGNYTSTKIIKETQFSLVTLSLGETQVLERDVLLSKYSSPIRSRSLHQLPAPYWTRPLVITVSHVSLPLLATSFTREKSSQFEIRINSAKTQQRILSTTLIML